jgi:hypothetical protein
MGTGGGQTAQEAREAPPQHDGRRDQCENRRASLSLTDSMRRRWCLSASASEGP